MITIRLTTGLCKKEKIKRQYLLKCLDGLKHNQKTTPKSITFSSEEKVTIVDPRHPLFGRTLSLIGITNNQYGGRYCAVKLPEGVSRLIPIEVTDLCPETVTIYSLPLSLSSVKQLLATYHRITSKSVEETEDESIRHQDGDTPAVAEAPENQGPGSSRGYLERVDSGAAEPCVPNISARVPSSGPKQPSGGKKQ